MLSLLVGSIAAIVQTDVKRMLAYSSIAHAGYVLIGVQAATAQGHERRALLRAHLHVHDDRRVRGRDASSRGRATTATRSTDYRGLASRRPVLAGLLTFFLLAQAGVPLTGGFVAKLSVFSAAIDVGQYWLALIGMLAAVIGAFVYLRIVLAMYAPPEDDAASDGPRIVVDAGTGIALTIAATAIIFLGVVPGDHARLRPRGHPTARALTPGAAVVAAQGSATSCWSPLVFGITLVRRPSVAPDLDVVVLHDEQTRDCPAST